MHGKGIYTWPNGKRYVGDYVNDKKEGKGVFTWPDGREYDGEWKNGKQHGVGKYKGSDGTTRVGNWENGKRIKWLGKLDNGGTIITLTEDDKKSEALKSDI